MKNKKTKTTMIVCLSMMVIPLLSACGKTKPELEYEYRTYLVEEDGNNLSFAVTWATWEAGSHFCADFLPGEGGTINVRCNQDTFDTITTDFVLDIGTNPPDTGKAVYSGDTTYYSWVKGAVVTSTEAIALDVNFSDNSFESSHDGNVQISGSWNPNEFDFVRGTTTISGDSMGMTGVIGAKGVIGVYHNSDTIAGGFTASRE